MVIGGLSPAGIAASVWANATRQVTSLASTQTAVASIATNINSGANLDMRPAAGKMRQLSMWTVTGDGDNSALYDGTTFKNVGNNGVLVQMAGNNTVGPAFQNPSGLTRAVTYAGWDWS